MVYVIIVYDVKVERVTKVCHFLREYLNWIQNSVFEGELTESNLERVTVKLKDLIDEANDSVLFYIFSNQKLMKRDKLGIEKSPLTTIM